MRTLAETLRIDEMLCARFALMGGAATTSKRQSLVALSTVLDAAAVPYAVIDDVAVQTWSAEPRTTLDIDVAVLAYASIPSDALLAAGFRLGARHQDTENWTGPDSTPVQFSADPAFAAAVRGARPFEMDGAVVRVAPVEELIRAKLRAARDPARRKSKRLRDATDAAELAEQHPAVLTALTDAERRALSAP